MRKLQKIIILLLLMLIFLAIGFLSDWGIISKAMIFISGIFLGVAITKL